MIKELGRALGVIAFAVIMVLAGALLIYNVARLVSHGWHAGSPESDTGRMDHGCLVIGQPVAGECAQRGPHCATEDGNDGSGQLCFWRDPTTGDTWLIVPADRG